MTNQAVNVPLIASLHALGNARGHSALVRTADDARNRLKRPS